MCWTQNKTLRKNERGHLLLVLIGILFFSAHPSSGQIYLPPSPPQQVSDYGKVILNSHSSSPGPGPVIFDHWLHRAKFTCRLCHVDLGFAMQANGTGITANTNRLGFHCGTCHNGTRLFQDKPIFASCSDNANGKECTRCHSLGKPGVRKYEYQSFTAKLPKSIYGVDWKAAEAKGTIKPVDFLEGISVKRVPMQTREDFSIKAGLTWVQPITFSHEKHATWNGCELCHPEIFPSAHKETVRHSMFLNIEGRNCGACHGKVAFPLNNCQQCHPRGPLWSSQSDAAWPH